MNFFLKIILLLSFSLSLVSGYSFRETKTISLKKDEQKKILVKYENFEKLFKSETKEAIFDFLLSDKNMQISLKYLKNS